MNITEYIEQHTTAETDLLAHITHETNVTLLNPHMLSGQVQGRFLAMISRMIKPQRILELGTFTGYSALCLAEGLTDNGELHTIEHNDELEDMIRHNFSLSPLSNKLHLHIGDALQVISEMAESAPFDLVFIDADKRQYSAYYDAILPIVREGGYIIADNTLWDGHIIDPAYDRDPQTKALRLFNDKVSQDDRVEQLILPVRDGITIMRKLAL